MRQLTLCDSGDDVFFLAPFLKSADGFEESDAVDDRKPREDFIAMLN